MGGLGSVCEWRRIVLVLVTGLMTACGGGGGGGGGQDDTTPVSMTFEPQTLSVTSIEGFEAEARFVASFDPGGRSSLFLGVAEPERLVVDGEVSVGGNSLYATLRLSSDLKPGVHTSDVYVMACADVQCTSELPGSPFLLPLRYEVLEQIKVQPPQPMYRVGRDPAPVQSLAAVLPARAGTISVDVQGHRDAFAVEIQGDRLVVQTRQLPAGVYTARVELAGSADERYRAGVDLHYEVAPPPGGERPLEVVPSQFDLRLAQGTQSTYRFKVERPTWTDALDPVQLVRADSGVVRDLRSLGNDEYEFTVDTANLAPGAPPNSGQSGYFAGYLVSAGDHGGAASVSISVYVDAPLRLGSPDLSLLVSATTTAAGLERSTMVDAIDGAAVRWTARSDQPWLQVLRDAGTTGIDALSYRIDASVLAREGVDHEARLTLALERPGTLPVEVPVVVRNFVPRFDMTSPGVLVGGRAKVYLHGQVRRESELLRAGVLSVSGATLQSVAIEEDSRFIGSVPLLAVTLGDIIPGQAVTIGTASTLRPTSVTLPSVGALRVPLGHAVLPLGTYRPPSFAPNGRALVFAGNDAVWRWPLGDAAWGAPERQDVAGVIDAAFAPDESGVFATVPGAVLALDPVTLATRRRGPLPADSIEAFDTTVSPFAGAFAYAADGRALASVVPARNFTGHGVAWLAGCPGTGEFAADVSRGPCFGDPGSPYLQDSSVAPNGASIARSESGATLALSHPSGLTLAYRGIVAQRQELARLPAGRSVVGLDNGGKVLVRDDGLLLRSGTSVARLPTLLPPGLVAGGYAVTGGGERVAVYAYRIADEATGPRARDAQVLLFSVPAALNARPALLATIALPDAVGCTAPLAASETCEHPAALRVAPGNASLFVVGPRGVAAVPLPAPGAAQAPAPVPSIFRQVVPAAGPVER